MAGAERLGAGAAYSPVSEVEGREGDSGLLVEVGSGRAGGARNRERATARAGPACCNAGDERAGVSESTSVTRVRRARDAGNSSMSACMNLAGSPKVR